MTVEEKKNVLKNEYSHMTEYDDMLIFTNGFEEGDECFVLDIGDEGTFDCAVGTVAGLVRLSDCGFDDAIYSERVKSMMFGGYDVTGEFVEDDDCIYAGFKMESFAG